MAGMSQTRVGETRVYCRVQGADLRAWAAREQVDLAGRPAHAVTPRVRAAFPDDDEEELEYAALWSAAQRPEPSDPTGGRVIAALDVPAQWVSPCGGEDPDRGFEVDLDRPLPASRLVALHVLPADAGEDDELSWYDAAELDALLTDLL